MGRFIKTIFSGAFTGTANSSICEPVGNNPDEVKAKLEKYRSMHSTNVFVVSNNIDKITVEAPLAKNRRIRLEIGLINKLKERLKNDNYAKKALSGIEKTLTAIYKED